MKVIITSHNLKATEAIEERANTQLGKLDRLIPGILSARVNLENDTSKLHIPCKCVHDSGVVNTWWGQCSCPFCQGVSLRPGSWEFSHK